MFPEYRLTRVLTTSRQEKRYALAVPCDGPGDRTIWLSKEFNSAFNIPVNQALYGKCSIQRESVIAIQIFQPGEEFVKSGMADGKRGKNSFRFPSVVNASALLEDSITGKGGIFEELGARARPTRR